MKRVTVTLRSAAIPKIDRRWNEVPEDWEHLDETHWDEHGVWFTRADERMSEMYPWWTVTHLKIEDCVCNVCLRDEREGK